VIKKTSILLIVMMMLSMFSIPVFADENYDAVIVSKILDNTQVSHLKAKEAILMDSASGQILLEQNTHQKVPIASVTKIMSMLLIMEAIDSGKIKFTDMVPVSIHSYDMGGSQVWLKPGEEFSVKDMMNAVAIHSANDATVALAEFVSGSEDSFVMAMNQKAKALGMNETHFHDCTGLDDEGYSCANDVAIMSRELIIKHPKILDFTKIWHTTFRQGKVSLDNTNKLIMNYKGTIGLKTGFTTKAGQNLSAVVKRDNMTLISVVLGEPDSNTRFAETQKLMDYGFSNFETTKVNNKGDKVAEADVVKGIETTVNGVLSKDVSLIVNKGDITKIKKEVKLQQGLTAPIKAGQKIGEVIYKLGGKEIGKADVAAEKEVQKASFFRLFFRMILSWFGIGKK
jgi:serine-type D-Ala-D-Ala carboxypeptidase (penicillin-binding protein 5/6)